jgi:hypothetical protein
MSGFSDAVKYLYSQFILRDVLSFITPGVIVILTAVYVFDESFSSLSIHWLFYIPLFGIAFVIGFAIQCFGEIIGFVSFRPNIKITCVDKMKILFCRWREPEDNRCKWNDPENPLGMKKAYEEDQDFWKAVKGDEDKKQGRERVVVLTQMCINNALALFITGITYAIYHGSSFAAQVVEYIWLVIFIASLFWGHRVHVLRRFNREETIKKHWKRIYIDNK